MGDRKPAGEQPLLGRKAEKQAEEIGSDSSSHPADDQYLLFANSSRSYFQFQMKDEDSTN